MSGMKLPKETREELVNRFREYYAEQLGESIGTLVAESLVLFVAEQLGPHIYNQALEDASVMVRGLLERMDEDLYALRRPFPQNARR